MSAPRPERVPLIRTEGSNDLTTSVGLGYRPTDLPTNLPAELATYRPTCLPTYLLTYPPSTHPPTQPARQPLTPPNLHRVHRKWLVLNGRWEVVGGCCCMVDCWWPPLGELNLVTSLGERKIINADVPTVLRICGSNRFPFPKRSHKVKFPRGCTANTSFFWC